MADEGGAVLAPCALMLIVARDDRRCWVRACGKPLPPRRRRWCSQECSRLWGRWHSWSESRQYCLELANWTCQRCGFQSRQTVPVQYGHRWGNWIEVNHIVPRNGAGYGTGCWNHQDNLEVLCAQCHHEVTAQQRRDRAAPGQDASTVAPGPRFPASGSPSAPPGAKRPRRG